MNLVDVIRLFGEVVSAWRREVSAEATLYVDKYTVDHVGADVEHFRRELAHVRLPEWQPSAFRDWSDIVAERYFRRGLIDTLDRFLGRLRLVVEISATDTTLPIVLTQTVQAVRTTAAKEFVEEAVQCYTFRLYRAAVVLSWVGAVALLQTHIFNSLLDVFNNAAAVRYPKRWKAAATVADLAQISEHQLLQVLDDIGVIGAATKKELQNCLDLRNSCGHPTELQVGAARAFAHLEILFLNVFAKFG
jgi:hypothetical protein